MSLSTVPQPCVAQAATPSAPRLDRNPDARRSRRRQPRPVTCAFLLLACMQAGLSGAAWSTATAPRALADESDRAAFRGWFALLSELQFEHTAAEVTDCASLVRFAYREALRAHTPEWLRRIGLPVTPLYPDVRSGPRPGPQGWPLFSIRAGTPLYGEFADARTLIRLNSRPLGRSSRAARSADLLYFHQPGQRQPDHLMVFVGPSVFDSEAVDWVVYHTGPDASSAGEVRKVRLVDLLHHPSPRWRPSPDNPHFIGVFRWALL